MMLCEEYPSLFDSAKIRNVFEKTKQSPDFNIRFGFYISIQRDI